MCSTKFKTKIMKKKIIELGKKHGLKLRVESNREAFDIIDYEVYHDNEFIEGYRYYTGKTNTGVEYPTECFLPELENHLEKYKLSIAHI